jgi:hypothetical protein
MQKFAVWVDAIARKDTPKLPLEVFQRQGQ